MLLLNHSITAQIDFLLEMNSIPVREMKSIPVREMKSILVRELNPLQVRIHVDAEKIDIAQINQSQSP